MLDIDFERPGTFYPGDKFTCTVDVQSWFKINCKYVKVRLRCPYRKSEVEVFRVYEIANQRIDTGDDESDYRIGGKAENIVLQRGRNRFIVSCKIPDVPDETFKKYSNVIRCSFKVTVNANWLPKRCCLDWFVLAPRTVAEEIFDKIEDGGHKVFSSIRSRIRGQKGKTFQGLVLAGYADRNFFQCILIELKAKFLRLQTCSNRQIEDCLV